MGDGKDVSRDAGRELDQLVSDAVFGPWDESRCRVCGWKIAAWNEQGCWADNCSLRPPPERRADEPRPYSTDIAAAWEIVAELDKRGLFLTMERHGERLSGDEFFMRWACGFWPGTTYLQEAMTAPHAICLAALKTVEAR